MAFVSGLIRETSYNPAARFEIKVSEAEFRRNRAGRVLMARI